MTKQELLRSIEPFDDDTVVAVEYLSTHGVFEMATYGVEYKPMVGDLPAYLTIRTYDKPAAPTADEGTA
jgi:hypothetical protein